MKKLLLLLCLSAALYAMHSHDGNCSETKMHKAIMNDKTDAVAQLIQDGLDIHWKNLMGDSFLHLVASLGRLEIAQQLLNAGADINVVSEDGRTPLLNALKFNHPEFARWLMDHGADVTKGHMHGKTVLRYAQTSEYDGVRGLAHQIEYLIKKKQESI